MSASFQKLCSHLKIRIIFFIFILIFTLVPSVFCAFTITNYLDNKMTGQYFNDYLNAINSEIESGIGNMTYQINMTALNIVNNDKLFNTVTDKELPYEAKKTVVCSELKKITEGNKYISAVSVISHDGNKYDFFSKNINDIELKSMDFLEKTTRTNLVLNHRSIKHGTENYILFGKRLFNIYNSYDMGYMVVYVNENLLYNLYENPFFENGSFFLTSDDYIISHYDKDMLSSKFFDIVKLTSDDNTSVSINNKYHIYEVRLENNLLDSEIKSYGIVTYEWITKMKNRFFKAMLLTIIIIILISVVWAWFISYRMLKEVFTLKNHIGCFVSNLSHEIPFNNDNELWALEQDFNWMAKQIHDLIEKNSREMEEKRILELRTLQSQISPHFLYNALDSISWAVKLNQPNQIENSIQALASFYRIGLHNGDNIITVREEFEHVKNYLTIEENLHMGSFSTQLDISPEVDDILIIKIILQPIAENCIKHGFADIDYHGVISISSYLEEEKILVLEVSDNGCGINANELTTEQMGYGLRNIKERLSLEYGTNYSMSVTANPDKGTTVRIKISRIIHK